MWAKWEMNLAQGVQEHNVMACVKHYAANNIERTVDSSSMSVADDRTMHEVYLPHFKKIARRVRAFVMGAYNRVNGDYSSRTPNC